MTEENSSALLDKVGKMVTEAASTINFQSGNENTKVFPGFPFTVVKNLPAANLAQEPGKEVAPLYRFPYYSEGGDGGSKIFVTPYNPATTINGVPCYATPQPYLFLAEEEIGLIYLKQRFQVYCWQQCLGPPAFLALTEIERIDTLSAEIQLYPDGEIPESTYPTPEVDPCNNPVGPANAYFGWPGVYTYYFLLGRFKGARNAPVVDYFVHSNLGEFSGNSEILEADYLKNYAARDLTVNYFDPLYATFPVGWEYNLPSVTINQDSAGGTGYVASSWQ